MDRFPQIEQNQTNIFGPILVMDQGFEKFRLVKALSLNTKSLLLQPLLAQSTQLYHLVHWMPMLIS
jgi:hypothetical protein